jgi:hypothetical protein
VYCLHLARVNLLIYTFSKAEGEGAENAEAAREDTAVSPPAAAAFNPATATAATVATVALHPATATPGATAGDLEGAWVNFLFYSIDNTNEVKKTQPEAYVSVGCGAFLSIGLLQRSTMQGAIFDRSKTAFDTLQGVTLNRVTIRVLPADLANQMLRKRTLSAKDIDAIIFNDNGDEAEDRLLLPLDVLGDVATAVRAEFDFRGISIVFMHIEVTAPPAAAAAAFPAAIAAAAAAATSG